MIEERLRAWDGEFLSVRFDGPTGAWMLLGVHSSALGPGMGGTRLKVYPGPDDAVTDVLRLSAAMTAKNALAGLPFGGGKAVLAVPSIPEGEARRTLLHRYGELIESLGGSYVTACDMNTTDRDMDTVAERTSHVLGRSLEGGGSGSSAPATATGVFHGIRASVRHVFGSADLTGRTVLVQGTGAVGAALAGQLADAGAGVLVSDVVAERATAVADRVGGKVVAPEDALGTTCDVFAPCATGGVIDEATVPALECRIVAGAANNQLAGREDADRLRERGILYAPDYAINAGGVLSLAGLERLGWTPEQLDERLAGIGATLAELFALADQQGSTPDAAADALVRHRLDAADLTPQT